jgi:hypothetical protein
MKPMAAAILGFAVAPIAPVIVGGILTPPAKDFDLLGFVALGCLRIFSH